MKHAFALAALVATAIPAAQAATTTFQSGLLPETPGATGSGLVEVIYDSTAHTLTIDSSFHAYPVACQNQQINGADGYLAIDDEAKFGHEPCSVSISNGVAAATG